MTTKRAKLSTLLALYMAQSIPMAFFSTVVPIIMRQEAFSLSSIGMLQLLKLPWIFKFLWAPLIDEKGNTMPRLKGLIVKSELFYAIVIFLIAIMDIREYFYITLVLMIMSFVVSATQDIAVDRFAIIVLNKDERSMGNSMQSSGSFVGSLLGTGVLLMLYHYIGWTAVITLISLAVVIALIPLLKMDIPASTSFYKKRVSIKDIRSFFVQKGAVKLSILLLFYYSGIIGIMAMIKPLMVDYGYTTFEIAIIMGVAGSSAATLMALCSGIIIRSIGLKKSMYIYSILAVVSALFLAIFVSKGCAEWKLILGVILPWATYGAMSVGIYTLGMNNVRERREGTDFTLMIVLTHLGSIVVAAVSGRIAQSFGYINLFILEAVLSVFTIFLLSKANKERL